jgi:hypothetical protein
MPRQSYTKPNSKTQQECTSNAATVAAVLQRTRLTKDEWISLLFETGWQLVQQQEPDPDVRVAILQDSSLGFWAWWISAFIAHDALLVERKLLRHYYQQKWHMANTVEIDFIGDSYFRK